MWTFASFSAKYTYLDPKWNWKVLIDYFEIFCIYFWEHSATFPSSLKKSPNGQYSCICILVRKLKAKWWCAVWSRGLNFCITCIFQGCAKSFQSNALCLCCWEDTQSSICRTYRYFRNCNPDFLSILKLGRTSSFFRCNFQTNGFLNPKNHGIYIHSWIRVFFISFNPPIGRNVAYTFPSFS